MPKAKIFKLGLCACLLWGIGASAGAQSSLGKIIEQTKKNKLDEIMPPPPPPPPPPAPAKDANAPKTPVDGTDALVDNSENFEESDIAPALWSLSGVNSRLIAEVWENKEVQRIVVTRGTTLSGGWVVMAADTQSLTIQRDREVRTLFPPAPGTTGQEFARWMPKPKKGETDILSMLKDDRSVGGGLPRIVTPNQMRAPSSATAGASAPSTANARAAATRLPVAGR